MTSNPAIFQKVIAKSDIYDIDIRKMASQNKDLNTIYKAISQQDVLNATDVFRPLYEETKVGQIIILNKRKDYNNVYQGKNIKRLQIRCH